jgi:hypothetical protein
MQNSMISAVAAKKITLKRAHGLGNVVCLLPVLNALTDQAIDTTVVTASKWTSTFAELRPAVHWTSSSSDPPIDLDLLTEALEPQEHRSDELGRLVGLQPPFAAPRLSVPEHWKQPFSHLHGAVVFAPEGGHRSRQWPHEKAQKLKTEFPDDRLVLIGTETEPAIPCDLDLRSQLQLQDLMAVLALAKAVITMDSGVLHIAAAIGVPTVALFGGIDPMHRIRKTQNVVVLHTDLDCFPCNKNETCDGRYPCIKSPTSKDVFNAVKQAQKKQGLQLNQIPSSQPAVTA